MTLQQTARKAALELLEAGQRKNSWSPVDRAQWTRAFNALQRLAGKKIVLADGVLVRDRKR